MKQLITLLMLACLGHGLAATPPVKKTVDRYEPFQEQTVVLPTPFAKPFIIDKSDAQLLAGKKIHHIDLVYTAYRSSPDFDQQALNDHRIAELRKLLPQIDSDRPAWAAIEQTGPKDRETANSCFHGFVIHYTDKENGDLRTFFSGKTNPMTTYTVHPDEGGNFRYPSGTQITVPANAVTYADGTPVKGAFEIHYREFRDPAEIALSGIPMTFSQAGTDYNFSSVGMYEVRGTQNGKELQLQKPVTVDFNCTKVVDDAAFYRLDDESGQWEQIEPIVFGNAQPAAVQAQAKAVPILNPVAVKPQAVEDDLPVGTGSIVSWEGKITPTIDSKDGLFMEYETVGDETTVRMNPGAWNKYSELIKTDPALQQKILSTDKQDRALLIRPKDYQLLTSLLFDMPSVTNSRVQAPKMNGTLLAEGADANHTYPALVRGLNSPEFGVYNADQIYRIESPLALSPVYTDAGTGKQITGLHVACVIDLTYNGSFSFQPNNITCNPKGRNVVLLFTNDEKVYMLDEQAFAAVDKKQLRVSFPMADVSDRLKTPEDLKQLLQL